MKKFNIILYASMAWMLSFQLTAQRKVPYNFHYPLNVTDSVVLRKVTTVSYPNTTALRLYFEDAYLGERSYLLLEGIDGAQQRLDAMTLKNWNYSSAYFNGGQATVSVYQSPGDSITFKIAALKVNERQEEAKDQQARKTAIQSTGNAKMAQLEEVEMPPYAAAVGRITNGNDARATVWIAANGAIVTHLGFATGEDGEGVYNYTGFDVVEFNVPQSNADGSVNHPAPEDQYPLNIEHITWNKIEGTWGPKKRILIKPYFGAGTGNERTWGGYAVVEALPNGTGKRPGERIQEYFQVTRHPSGPVMEGRRLDVFHHGFIKDNPMSQTLQMKKLEAYNPRDYLMFVMDKDRFLVYDEPGRRGTPWHQQRLGAPVTYEGSNVAVGIHTEALISGPLFGTGFRDEKFRQDLGEFFSSQMVYVDQASYWDTGNGKIDRPYLTVSEAAGNVEADGIVSIARGNYDESLTIDKSMTLQAPVGIVTIGAAGGNSSSRMFETYRLPATLFEESPGSSGSTDIVSEVKKPIRGYPNPFNDKVTIQYKLDKEWMVNIAVYDMFGKKITSLEASEKKTGVHALQWNGQDHTGRTVPPGTYVVKLRAGDSVTNLRVVKE